MPFLVDTNILLRAIQPSHSMHGAAIGALEILIEKEEPLFLAIQNIAEFWNAATRPSGDNGLGYTTEETRVEVARLEIYFEIVSENARTYDEWKSLISAHQVRGAQVHDARLVSIMKVHGIPRILTFNVGDFSRYQDVEAVHPGRIV